MARKRDKKSLYEVIGQGHFKSLPNKSLEEHRVVFTEKKPTEPPPEVKEKPAKWPSRPKMLEIIDGRLEFSLPYTILIAVGLALILVFLVFFRLGQLYEQRRTASIAIPAGNVNAGDKSPEIVNPGPRGANTEKPVMNQQSASQDRVADVDLIEGRNRIVIKQYPVRKDLVPAMEFFNSKGIETEIIQRGEVFFLVTKKNTYNNPNKAGTDGAIAIQTIKDIGAGYEPPEAGYEKFKFEDPYGEKAD